MRSEDASDFEPTRGARVLEHRFPPRSCLLGHPMTSPSGQTTETSPHGRKLALHGADPRSYTQPVPAPLIGRF